MSLILQKTPRASFLRRTADEMPEAVAADAYCQKNEFLARQEDMDVRQ
jgi:hypothetical protein